MRTRLLLAPLAWLALAAPASATEICVTPATGCAPADTYDTLKAAFVAAYAVDDADTVQLGAATYTAPTIDGFEFYGDPFPIVLRGVGERSVVTAPGPAAYVLRGFGVDGTAIEDLRVAVPDMLAGARALETTADVRRVRVDYVGPQPAQAFTGVALGEGARLEQSTVDLAMDGDADVIGVHVGNPDDEASAVVGTTVRARSGVDDNSDLEGARIEASRIQASNFGVRFEGLAGGRVRDSLITMTGASGLGIAVSARAPDVQVRNATLVGVGSAGVKAVGSGGSTTATAQVDSSIIHGLDLAVEAIAENGGAAAVETYYSDYDGADVQSLGGATIGETNRTFAGDGALDADQRPVAGSPLIDAGDPAQADPSATDLDGGARVQDGDGDGTARVDIGAFEHAPPVVMPTVTPDPDPQPAPSASPSPAPSAAPPAPVLSEVRVRRRRVRFTLNVDATVRLRIRRHGRVVRRRVAPLGAGRRALRVRRLPRGRYRLTLVATDALGRRSAVLARRFTITSTTGP